MTAPIAADGIDVLRQFKAQTKKAPLTTRDVSKSIGKSSVGIINRLAKKGLLEKVPTDEKQAQHKITPAGRKTIAAWDLLFS